MKFWGYFLKQNDRNPYKSTLAQLPRFFRPREVAGALCASAKTISEKTISPAPVRKLSAKTKLPRAPNAARARQIDAPRGRLTY